MKKKRWLFVALLVVFFLIGMFDNEEGEQNEEAVSHDTNVEVTEEVDVESEKTYTVDFKTEGRRDETTEDVDVVEEEEVQAEVEEVMEEEETVAEEKTETTTYEVVKKGRGNSDVSRDEPEYRGMVGYVALSNSDIDNEYETFPSSPWSVQAVEQSGPDVEDITETDVSIPHKTKVKVLEQHLSHQRYGNYDGWLLVQTVEEPVQTYKIDVHDFVTYAYWNCGAHEAAKMGPAIAVYNGKGAKPYNDDEYVDVEVGTEVYLSGTEYGGEVTAFVYREWKLGYGGVEVTFDPTSLDITY